MTAYLPQRIRDWLLERRIADVEFDMRTTYRGLLITSDCFNEYRRYAGLMAKHADLIAQRSPQQLARMKGRGE